MSHDESHRSSPLSAVALVLLSALLASACTDDPPGDPQRGGELFRTTGCAQCHRVGGGRHIGPDLAGVGGRYDQETLERWIDDPEAIYRERDRRPLNEGFPPMPAIPLEPGQVRNIAAYLAELRGDG